MSAQAMSSQAPSNAGTVKAIWCYPVKSMNGAKTERAIVTEGGLLGDRAYGVIDRANGRVASAKHSKKWAKLLALGARFTQAPETGGPIPPVRITLPDGAEITSDGDPDQRLSEIVGRFSDYAALHLLTTATLARLAELAPGSIFNARRFRPNLTIASPEGQSGFVENDWVGCTLAVGDDVRLRISDPTPRCAVPTLGQQGLPQDPKVLRTVVQHNSQPVPLLDGERLPCAGVYAFVIRGGVIGRGDRVRVE